MTHRVYKDSRHIRWHFEQSPDNPDLVRYHFVIVDDKNRDVTLSNLIEQLSISGPVEFIRETIGRVKDSKLRYLFASYDSATAPRMINWFKMGKPIREDPELKERVQKGRNIEDYVANCYER